MHTHYLHKNALCTNTNIQFNHIASTVVLYIGIMNTAKTVV